MSELSSACAAARQRPQPDRAVHRAVAAFARLAGPTTATRSDGRRSGWVIATACASRCSGHRPQRGFSTANLGRLGTPPPSQDPVYGIIVNVEAQRDTRRRCTTHCTMLASRVADTPRLRSAHSRNWAGPACRLGLRASVAGDDGTPRLCQQPVATSAHRIDLQQWTTTRRSS